MDKTEQDKGTTRPNREGFALMITLSVLAVVIALTVVLLSYFKEVKKDADHTQALIQANLYYTDIVKQFEKFKEKKELFDQLYLFPVALSAAEGRFSMTLRCEPLAKGVNVNWLALEKDIKHKTHFEEAQNLFDFLVQEHNIEDAARLREMLLLEMGDKHKTIVKKQSRLRQKEGIISYQQFEKIISEYQLEVDDLNVDKIAWQKYFSFLTTADKIDAQHSTAELLSFLFDIDLESVRDWTSSEERTSLKDFVNNSGGAYDEKKVLLAEDTFLDLSHCEVNYGQGYRFAFDYIEGEAKHFEFYGNY
ncbi:MAG: hypothetical protein GQ531_06030 [Sulfurovum sp.]|nr:hypothetical protein [Sulfurovum sp.]